MKLEAVTGDSIENLSSFKGAVESSGVGVDGLAQAMVRLSSRMATESAKAAQDLAQLPVAFEKAAVAAAQLALEQEKLGNSSSDYALKMESADFSIARTEQAMSNLGVEAARLSNEMEKSATDFAFSQASLSLSIGDAESALKKLLGTYTAADAEADKRRKIEEAELKIEQLKAKQTQDAADQEMKQQEFAMKQQELAMKRQELELKLKEQLAAKAKAAHDEYMKQKEDEVKAQELALKAQEQAAQAAKDYAENIVVLTSTFAKAAAGQQIFIDKSVSIQKQLEGMVAAVDAIVKQKIDWGQITPDEKRQEQLLQFATILRNIPDAEQRVALASQLVGRGFAEALLRMDPEKIRALQQSFKDLGLTITKVDEESIEKYKQATGELGYVIDTLKTKLGAMITPGFAAFWDAMAKAIEQSIPFWTALGNSIQQVFAIVQPLFPAIARGLVFMAQLLGVALLAVTMLAAGFAIAFGGIVVVIEQAWDALKFGVQLINLVANYLMDSFINPVIDAFNRFVKLVEDSFNAVAKSITDAFNAILAPIKTVVDKIAGWIQGLIDGIKALWAGLTGAGASVSTGGGGGGMAAGGLFVGRHGGVDTNLAYLTSGEFVMNTAAVQRYGVSAMHAINSLQAPRFALGGLNVGGSMPRTAGIIAGAGSASPRVLNLTIEGRSFQGLTVPEHTASALERFAVHSQIASVGRKQSWRR
jgi:actin-related protein